MHNHSYENELKFACERNLLFILKMDTEPRFEKEAKGDWELASCYDVTL